MSADIDIRFVPIDEFTRVRGHGLTPRQLMPILADMCRLNTLSAVKLAGSGHLGSSFSAMDIVAWLYNSEMNVVMLVGAMPTATSISLRRATMCPACTPSCIRSASSRTSDPQAASIRRSRRPPGRRCPRHRGELRLTWHGHFEGTRDRLGQAFSRPRRPRVRDDWRRRAAGRAELRGAEVHRQPGSTT